ncbi:MAG: hypothetical protein JJ931_10225 [Henriciella sp.]|nr:hypothetical protein [Henriciella sp.]MBO6695785.1 hypothetical protein [Henriciella sp.]
MTHSLKTACLSALSLAVLGSAAATEWKVGNLMPEGQEPTSDADGLYVLAENAEGPAIMLGCSDRLGVQARVYLNGMTPAGLAVEKARRVKTRSVKISTDSTEAKRDTWAYLKSKGQLISVRPWQGKRIFNAAIRGDIVNMDVTKVGDLAIELPEINDAFKSFAATCAATAPRKPSIDNTET